MKSHQENNQGLALFADRKFGMLIQWGLSSILGRGEWVLRNEKIPPAEYEALRHQFNGERFDADAIARLACEAGMKYIVPVTKHHDGFCLFDSELTDYTTAKNAAKRDFIGEIAEACHRHGLGFHPYYSLWDWHHPDFVPQDPQRWRRYLDYYRGQVRELCTRYGQTDGFWFDVGGGPRLEQYELPSVGEMIHGICPDTAVMCLDFWVGEGNILPDLTSGQPRLYSTAANNLHPGLFEICATIGERYCYCPDDTNFKSVTYLCRYLMEIVGHGGNLLLNLGPKADGSLDDKSVKRLQGMGRWLKKYGEAIYGTRAALHPRINPLGYTLVRDNQVFFFIKDQTPLLDQMATDANSLDHREDAGEVQFNGLMAEAESVQAVGSSGALTFSQEGMSLRVKISRSALDWPLFALKVQTKGPARLAGDIVAEPDGSYRLSAEWAAIYSPLPREPQLFDAHGTPDTMPQISMWVVATTQLAWLVQVKQAGRFRVVIEQSCGEKSPVGSYEIRFRGGTFLHASSIIDHSTGQAHEAETQGQRGRETVLQAQVRASGNRFIEVTLGEVGLPEGAVCVDLVPHFTGSYQFMSFRNLRLAPVGSDAKI